MSKLSSSGSGGIQAMIAVFETIHKEKSLIMEVWNISEVWTFKTHK